MVDLESDEHAEFVHDGDDDIEELQKLIEEHHLTKCDSEAELSNTGNRMLLTQEDQSEKPYYDKVPPISASKRPGQRLTPNRALIAQIPTSSVKWNLSDGRISTQQSGRLPPNVIKMSTVMLSAKKRLLSVSQYYEDKKHAKLLRSEYEPSPNEYYPHRSIALTLPSAPAYTFGSRHTGTCTSIRNTDPNNPGPGNYTPRIQFMSTKRHRPSFTIKGVRVP
ncbi:uncharacterized protein LOC117116708 [Anneissia japonica]|uniref:uncharacterized protein LOC117116708 n=1 Tax=Anneissia japonica TaxID=1529436 RepID=UPI0014257C07|nr:uncharacterized protein LOC117116708 [Anneissia japonica]